MGALLRNEWMKLARMKKPYIFALFIFVVLLLNLYRYEPGGSELTVWTFSYGQSVPMAVIEIFAQFMIIFIPIIVGDSIAHRQSQLYDDRHARHGHHCPSIQHAGVHRSLFARLLSRLFL